jgi:DHA1 family multidrug resistance protein-like MFS transporter
MIPVLAYTLEKNLALAGVAVAVAGAGRFVVSYATGTMLDKFGRKKVAIVGGSIRTIFSFAEGFSPTYLALVGFSFMSGIGTAIWMTGSATITADIASSRDRGSIIGGRQGFANLGQILGPIVGTAAWAATGDIRVPFIINGFSKLICVLIFTFLLPETRRPARTPAAAPATSAEPAVSSAPEPQQRGSAPRAASLIPAYAILFALFGMFVNNTFTAALSHTLLPLYLENQLLLAKVEWGIVISAISVGSLLLSVPAGKAVDRWNVGAAVVPGALVIGGSLLYFTAVSTPSISTMIGIGAGLGAGLSMLRVGTMAFAIDIAPPDARGRFFGKTHAAGNIGTLIGPLVVGAAAAGTGYGSAFLLLAGVFFAMVPIGLLMVRSTRSIVR